MSAAIAAGAARRGAEKRREIQAENAAHDKCVADAERALKKLRSATTVEELSDAIRRGTRVRSYLHELKKALPEAESRLKENTPPVTACHSAAARKPIPQRPTPHSPRADGTHPNPTPVAVAHACLRILSSQDECGCREHGGGGLHG